MDEASFDLDLDLISQVEALEGTYTENQPTDPDGEGKKQYTTLTNVPLPKETQSQDTPEDRADSPGIDFSQLQARFDPVLSPHEFQTTLEQRIPKNTQLASKWALSLFKEWRTWRNWTEASKKDDMWPIPALDSDDLKKLDYWLARFITEIRKKDNTPYPPGTLTNISAGIQRYMRDSLHRPDIWLLKKDDKHFKIFRDALDARRKTLMAKGLGTTPARADPVSVQDEGTLWDTEVIGFKDALSLSHGVYFYNCKIFGFRAKDEHSNLMAEQYSFGSDQDGSRYILYNGRLAKTITGRFNSNCTPRQVKHYAQPENPRCVVKLFQAYLQAIPQNGRFYRRPLPNLNGKVSFSCQNIGINKLSLYMKDMFGAAGISMDGRVITGHSGKVTCCTTLYDHDFDEQAITSRSGHKSTAVRAYKRPSTVLEHRISNSLQPPMPSTSSQTKMPCAAVNSEISDECVPSQPVPSVPASTQSEKNCNTTKSIDDLIKHDVFTLLIPSSVSEVALIKAGKRVVVQL